MNSKKKKNSFFRPSLFQLENRIALAGEIFAEAVTPISPNNNVKDLFGGIIATGAEAGGSPIVNIFEAESGQQICSFFAFDKSFTGGVRVALADINNDGMADIIAAAGPGGGPQVSIFDGKNLSLITSFFAYDVGFSGGVSISAGNFDGDSAIEIVTGAGAGGGPNVRIFEVVNNAAVLTSSFFAYDLGFRGGVNVAAGNFDGVAGDEIFTGAGSGGGPVVKIFQPNGNVLSSFFAYNQAFSGGVNISVGDLDLNGKAEIITGPGIGGGPNVRVFNGGNANLIGSFFASNQTFSGGVAVSLIDVNFDGYADITTALGQGGNSEIGIWNASTYSPIDSFNAYNPSFVGGVSISGTTRSPSFGNSTFVDPTATFVNANNIELQGSRIYIAPFVTLDATGGSIVIGNSTDLQDNVTLIPGNGGKMIIGDNVIFAHGANAFGSAQIGKTGGAPVFIGFNTIIDGAILEEDTFVMYLAKVAPGITIQSGTYVKPGKFIQTQQEADDPTLGKITLLNESANLSLRQGLDTFAAGVLRVNVDLARGYNELYNQGGILSVLGANLNPDTFYNSVESLPTLGGVVAAVSSFRNRIIGNVDTGDLLAQLNLVMGNRDSIRADEGTPFRFGTFRAIANQFTAHALVGSGIVAGNNNQFGTHSLVHGGEDTSSGITQRQTTLGSNITVGDWAVVFRSTIGDGVTLGEYSFIDNTTIAPGMTIPARAIYIDGVYRGQVEW